MTFDELSRIQTVSGNFVRIIITLTSILASKYLIRTNYSSYIYLNKTLV